MKIRTVKQYCCDFCGKKKYTVSAMIKHEKHCTKNINRVCRMCDILGTANDIKELIAMIPMPVFTDDRNINGFIIDEIKNQKELNESFEKMKEKAGNCPACILAVIRNIGHYHVFEYDYKKEVEKFWNDENENRRMEGY